MAGGARLALTLGVLLGVSVVGGRPATAAECAASTGAADLDAFFGGDDAAGLSGADYPHAYPLGDGRVLWLFQDAFSGTDADLSDDSFAHNAALLQDGACFEQLPTSGGNGSSWLGSWVETELHLWFWPLDAEIGADGNLWLYLAEVRNSNGDGAARGASPVATWRARYDLPSLDFVDLEPASDASGALFGYSIVSDDAWTYLYGHCYRQFEDGGGFGHDPDCSPYAYLARVPKGRMDEPLQYWDGTSWSSERADREPVFIGSASMPVSVERFGDVYVAASDENDWFGDTVRIRTAAAPQGPWTEVTSIVPTTRCSEGCNNYGAYVLPWLDGDQVVVALSNNAWDMRADAFDDASLYRIDLHNVTVPGVDIATVAAAEARRAAPDPPAAGPDVSSVARQAIDGASRAVDTVKIVDAIRTVDDAGDGRDGRDLGDILFDGVRMIAAVLAAALVGIAMVGFARSSRRVNPQRQRGSLARLRSSGGPTRRHGEPMTAIEPAEPDELTSVG